MKYHISALLLLLCSSFNSLSQDILVRRDSVRIECQLIKIGENDISYKPIDQLDGPLYSVRSNRIAYYILKNGTKVLVAPASDWSAAADSSAINNSLRVNLFSWILGHLSLEYERKINNQLAFTTELGYIGIDVDNFTGARGFYSTLGIKIYDSKYRRPSREIKRDFVAGGYVSSKIHIENFETSMNVVPSSPLTRYNFTNTSMGMSIGAGFGMHFFKRLNFDAGGSLGYRIFNIHTPQREGITINNLYEKQNYTQLYLNDRGPLYVEFTIALGFNF